MVIRQRGSGGGVLGGGGGGAGGGVEVSITGIGVGVEVSTMDTGTWVGETVVAAAVVGAGVTVPACGAWAIVKVFDIGAD